MDLILNQQCKLHKMKQDIWEQILLLYHHIQEQATEFINKMFGEKYSSPRQYSRSQMTKASYVEHKLSLQTNRNTTKDFWETLEKNLVFPGYLLLSNFSLT